MKGLFNLIVYDRGDHRSSFVQDMVEKVLKKLPCRIIFIEESSGDHLEVEPAVRACGGEGSTINCDSLKIRVGGSELAKVPFLILPEMIPDLPIYLIWGEDPTKDDVIFSRLEKMTDRVIFDSEGSSCLQTFSKALIKRLSLLHCELVDMNWIRISSWRRLIAEVFESPERLKDLSQADTIKIFYNPRISDAVHHTDIQAIYLHGWLAALLGWEFQSLKKEDKVITIVCNNGSKEIISVLTPKEDPNPSPGTIFGMEVHAENGTIYKLMRQGATYEVNIEVASPQRCEIPATMMLSHLERSQFFIKEVFYEPTSNHYRQMIEWISKVDWDHG